MNHPFPLSSVRPAARMASAAGVALPGAAGPAPAHSGQPGTAARGTCGSGFTLIELLVVVSVIAVLASMLLPAIATVRQQARRLACAANQRQIGLAHLGYAADNEGALVYSALITGTSTTQRWGELLAGYVEAKVTNHGAGVVDLALPSVLTGCTEWKATQVWVLGYGQNSYPDRPARWSATNRLDLRDPPDANVVTFVLSQLSFPSSRLLLTDTTDYHTIGVVALTRHRGRFNVLFCDGHVQPLAGQAQLDRVLSHPELGLP